MRQLTALIAGCSFLVACYAYTPIPIAQTTTSGDVRITLTESAQTENFRPIGTQVRALEGKLSSIDDSSVTIGVTEVARASTDEDRFHGELVTIPRQRIAALDRRHVNVARSLLLTGLITGAAIWIGIQGHGSVDQIRTKGPSPGQ
jgi:hypothetical protein